FLYKTLMMSREGIFDENSVKSEGGLLPDPGATSKDRESGNSLSTPRSYWILARSTEMLGGVPYSLEGVDTMILIHELLEVVPVFSFSEEAELFLWLGGYGDRWRVVEVSSRTLLGMLEGFYSRVDEIALDPIPEAQVRSFMGLVTVDRDSFVRSLAGRDSDPRPSSPPGA
ncbi:MAG: hypothetical protein ACR2KW_05610, partial [Rubrobacter sp.]